MTCPCPRPPRVTDDVVRVHLEVAAGAPPGTSIEVMSPDTWHIVAWRRCRSVTREGPCPVEFCHRVEGHGPYHHSGVEGTGNWSAAHSETWTDDTPRTPWPVPCWVRTQAEAETWRPSQWPSADLSAVTPEEVCAVINAAPSGPAMAAVPVGPRARPATEAESVAAWGIHDPSDEVVEPCGFCGSTDCNHVVIGGTDIIGGADDEEEPAWDSGPDYDEECADDPRDLPCPARLGTTCRLAACEADGCELMRSDMADVAALAAEATPPAPAQDTWRVGDMARYHGQGGLLRVIGVSDELDSRGWHTRLTVVDPMNHGHRSLVVDASEYVRASSTDLQILNHGERAAAGSRPVALRGRRSPRVWDVSLSAEEYGAWQRFCCVLAAWTQAVVNLVGPHAATLTRIKEKRAELARLRALDWQRSVGCNLCGGLCRCDEGRVSP